jgi:tetratricopeptide (TPR) repeat protein
MSGDAVPEIRAIWDEARQYIESGNYDKAIETYRYILIRYADDPVAVEHANAYLADLFLTLKKLDFAEEHVKKAISLKPQKAAYRYILGFVYSDKKQWDRAISEFEIAVKKEPNDGEYLRGLGWATYSSGDVAKGLSLLKEADRLTPDNAKILTDLAVVSLSSLNIDEAKQYAERAVQRDPTDPLAQDVYRKVLWFTRRLSQDMKRS